MTRVFLCLLLLTCPAFARAGIIYAVTFDTVLNNDGAGVFGGDLGIGQGQPVNATLEYTYSERPSSTGPGTSHIDGRAVFDLLGVRVIDNTNGLASDVFGVGGGWLELTYRDNRDWFSGAGREGPASGLLLPGFADFFAQLGDVGDLLPYGDVFDDLVEGGQVTLMATAGANELQQPGSFLFNYVNQLFGGIEPIGRGDFSFESRYIPVPPLPSLLLIGLFGLALSQFRGGGSGGREQKGAGY